MRPKHSYLVPSSDKSQKCAVLYFSLGFSVHCLFLTVLGVSVYYMQNMMRCGNCAGFKTEEKDSKCWSE